MLSIIMTTNEMRQSNKSHILWANGRRQYYDWRTANQTFDNE